MKDGVRNCTNISESNTAVDAMKELQKLALLMWQYATY